MPIGMRTLGLVTLASTALPVVVASVAPGFDRLAAMPPRTRLELADRLERFDRLPAAEQRSIRALDEALGRLDPGERRRYLDLLRRFGAWSRGLDEDARDELAAAPPGRRLELVRERLGPGGTPDSPGMDPALWVLADTFNPVPLYDAATLLRVWSMLDEPDRRRVESARAEDETLATLRQLGRERGIEPAPAVREAFREIIDEPSRRGSPGQIGAQFREQVGDLSSWILDAYDPPAGRPGPGLGNPPRRPPASANMPERTRMVLARLAPARLRLLRLAEVEYLRVVRDPPGATPLDELLSFEARMPDWYRGTLDPLPPEMARLRLRALHRLVQGDPDLQRWLSTASPPDPQGPSGRPETPGRGQRSQVTF